jgi:hypothetical protein
MSKRAKGQTPKSAEGHSKYLGDKMADGFLGLSTIVFFVASAVKWFLGEAEDVKEFILTIISGGFERMVVSVYVVMILIYIAYRAGSRLFRDYNKDV